MRFSREEMLDELRTIFLFEADHLLMGAGEIIAESFIGFPVPRDGQYCFETPQRVDLSRFEITDKFVRGYDIAFQPNVLVAFDGSEFQDLNVFMQGTPRAGGISAGGETHRFMTHDGFCQTVADAAFARWKLDWDEAGGLETFTIRDLALLSNMTEGAVRNAIADKTDNGLRAIPASKPVSVVHEEALRWLKGRRGFIQSPLRPREDGVLKESLRKIDSAAALGELVARLIRLGFGSKSVDGQSRRLANDFGAWCDGSFKFDEDQAREIARMLELDVPLFVGKSLEVSLRRDAPRSGDAP